MSARPHPRPTRRTVLGAALVAPLAACTSSGDEEPSPPPPVDPDVVLRDAAVLRERELLATYDAALAASPRLAARLRPLRAEHAEHLAVLQDPALVGSPLPTASPTPVAPLRPAPGTGALVAAERAASRAHAAAAVRAAPGLAQVLASLAASEATHEIALVP